MTSDGGSVQGQTSVSAGLMAKPVRGRCRPGPKPPCAVLRLSKERQRKALIGARGSGVTYNPLERQRAHMAKRFIPSEDSLRMPYLRASGVRVLLLSSALLTCRGKTKKGYFGSGASPFLELLQARGLRGGA